MAVQNSFTLNSVDYGDANHLLHVVRYSRVIPEFRVNIEQLAQADGAATQGTLHGARIWNLECAVVASSPSAADTAYDNVVSDLEAAHAAGLTTFAPEWETDTWEARPYGGPVEPEILINGYRFTLLIIAPNPDAN